MVQDGTGDNLKDLVKAVVLEDVQLRSIAAGTGHIRIPRRIYPDPEVFAEHREAGRCSLEWIVLDCPQSLSSRGP